MAFKNASKIIKKLKRVLMINSFKFHNHGKKNVHKKSLQRVFELLRKDAHQ